MDRELLARKLVDILEKRITLEFTEDEKNKIYQDAFNIHAKYMNGKYGLFDLLKLQEECCELSKEVSDEIFDNTTDYGIQHLSLYEEAVDVILAIEMLFQLLDTDMSVIDAIKNIKIERIKEKCKDCNKIAEKSDKYDYIFNIMK